MDDHKFEQWPPIEGDNSNLAGGLLVLAVAVVATVVTIIWLCNLMW
jgi:hypothetical protein